MVITNLKELKI